MTLKERLESIVAFYRDYDTRIDFQDEKSYTRSDVYHCGRGEGELALAKLLLKEYKND
jgi:hypothetical protein